MSGCANQTLLVAAINHGFFQFANISNKLVGVKGSDFEMLRVLSSKMNFQYELVTPNDRQWGVCDDMGHCSGMIGMLTRQEADMGISVISYTASRAKFVNFSYPYFHEEHVFITKNINDYQQVNRLFFTNPFEGQVWILFGSLLILLISIIKLLKYFEILRTNIMRVHTMLAIIFRQDVNLKRKSNNLKVAMTILVFIVIAGCTCKLYECVLTSETSFIPITPPIDTISDMANAIQNSDYVMSAVEGTAYYQAIMTSKLEYMLEIVAKSTSNRNFVTTKTFKELINMMLHEKIATVESEIFIKGDLVQMNLPLETLHFGKETLNINHVAVALRKDFPCENDLNKWIKILVESGSINKWLSKDTTGFNRSTPYVSASSHIAIGDLKFIFVALLSGYLAGLVSLLLEMMIKYC